MDCTADILGLSTNFHTPAVSNDDHDLSFPFHFALDSVDPNLEQLISDVWEQHFDPSWLPFTPALTFTSLSPAAETVVSQQSPSPTTPFESFKDFSVEQKKYSDGEQLVLVRPQPITPLSPFLEGGLRKESVPDPIPERPRRNVVLPPDRSNHREYYCVHDGVRCKHSGPFHKMSTFIEHLNSWAGLGRYPCDHCGVPFNRTSNRKRHLKICPSLHHDNSRKVSPAANRRKRLVVSPAPPMDALMSLSSA